MGAGCHFHAGLDFCNFASQVGKFEVVQKASGF